MNIFFKKHKKIIVSVGKIAKKAVCRTVFLTTKNALLQTVFLAILPTG